MPTTYAHDRFGREVYQQLPPEWKRRIRDQKKLYLIGLHGPDLFFYYHPFQKNRISELGSRLHQQKASDFFGEQIRKVQEEPCEAMEVYLYGFVCHYLLDSACHPYIGEYLSRTGVSHAKIETCLDRELMLMDGKDPLRYHPAAGICPHTVGNEVIHRCFPSVSVSEIEECLRGMKRYTRVTICKKEWKRQFLRTGMKIAGCYDSMEGRIMPETMDPLCKEGVENLLSLYQKTLAEAPSVLQNFAEAVRGKEELSERFSRNFG